MNSHCIRYLVACGLLMPVWQSVSGVAFAQPQASLKLEDIIQAGQRRQDRVASLHVRFTQQVTDAKDSRSLPKRLNPKGEVIPPRDVTYDSHTEVWIDGEKMRYAFDDHQWSRTEQVFVPSLQVATFDGKLLKILFERNAPDKPYPFGSIEAKQRHFASSSPHLIPVLMTFRALNPKMRGFDISQMTLTGRQAQIGGHRCHEIQLQQPTSSIVDHLWVDPSRDCVIPRYVEMNNGKLNYQIDVRFTKDSGAGWVPSEWNYVWQFPDGRLRSSAKSTVTDYEINPTIPASQFDIAFPRGTYMMNLVTGEKYIIKTDGDERPIHTEELGLSYQELISSEPGESIGQNPSFFQRWGVWLLTIFLSGLMLVFYCVWYKRWRVRSS